jgi:hypothetical protein
MRLVDNIGWNFRDIQRETTKGFARKCLCAIAIGIKVCQGESAAEAMGCGDEKFQVCVHHMCSTLCLHVCVPDTHSNMHTCIHAYFKPLSHMRDSGQK